MADPIIRKRPPPSDSRVERLILTGMIVSDRFLQEIQPMIDGGGKLQVSYANRIAGWCTDYWKKYGKAPLVHIEDLYQHFGRDLPEEETLIIEDFLAGLSDEYERGDGRFNVDYVLDEAEKHFRLSSLKLLKEDLTLLMAGSRIEEAEEKIKNYQRPNRPKIKGVDPLRDTDAIIEALKPEEDNRDIIMYLPGALGEACGPIERGGLYAIQAESGVGKTWWLGFISKLAVLNGFNVLFVSLEMAVRKMIRRIWQDLCALPLKGEKTIKLPVFDCLQNQSGECRLPQRIGQGKIIGNKATPGYLPCAACRETEEWDMEKLATYWKEEIRPNLDPGIGIGKQNSMNRAGTLTRAGKFHMVEFPSDGLSIEELRAYANNLEYYEGFISDMIVTDYADKFKWPIPNDARNSIGKIWSGHKGIGQEKHCAVFTASQSNTERSGKRVGQGSWSETIEKRRMIDLGIAFNQKEKDYVRGLMFATIDKMRNGEKIMSHEIAILQQLSIGHPYIDSCLVRRKIK